MSRHSCCNNCLNAPDYNTNTVNFTNSTIFILIILYIFAGSGSGDCNFWNGYCNAFGSSGFNDADYLGNNLPN